MAKEEKPIEYQGRVRDTKRVAQRLDLNYLKGPALLGILRRRITWAMVAVAALAAVPLVLGVGGSKKALLSGPVSSAHAIFEDRCEQCHTQAFGSVPDRACETCHDGPAHPAKAADTARPNSSPPCAQCHQEHRGVPELARVNNRNCTACHANLSEHASGVKLAAREISAFRPGKHPEFAPRSQADARPLHLNHAIHMPSKATNVRGIQLPMQCGDCHATDRNSPTGELVPVTFEKNCRTCHARELEFDVYEVLGGRSAPSPHTKDPRTIHDFILNTYRQAVAADPNIIRRPLGNDLAASPSAAAWLDRVTGDSERFLFQRKCNYCHEYAGIDQGFPVVKKVNRIQGRYVEAKPEGENWLQRGEFSHRAHRAVECESCHQAARASTRTADILIPAMKNCLPCHGDSKAGLDRCSECHLYHNRSLEKERRRPAGEVFPGR